MTIPLPTKRPIKILFLAANPEDTVSLGIDKEVREIKQALLKTEFRDKFDFEQEFAVRASDLQGHLLRHKPDIVHFSGHGSNASEIILEDDFGGSHKVSEHALSQLFAVLKDNIRCVVFNACYSAQQAQAIAQHIDCVVGMSQALGDEAAISFAVAFYRALGYGKDVKTAFDLGCLQIHLENLKEQDTPKLLNIKNNAREIIFAQQNKPEEHMIDLASLTTMIIAALSPLLAKGAEEVAKTVFKDAYQTIKDRLTKKPESKNAVEKFEQNPGTGATAFQSVLAEHLANDAELVRMLAEALEKSGATAPGQLVGTINAQKVVVANKIDTLNM